MAKCDVILHFRDTKIHLVRSLPTSKEVRDKLKETYKHFHIASQVAINKQLMQLSMSETQSAPEFLEKWQSTLDKGYRTCLNILEPKQITMLISALTSSWRAFITIQFINKIATFIM